MTLNEIISFIERVGFPVTIAIGSIVALVYVVKWLTSQHREERKEMHKSIEKMSERHIKSNENLIKALDELRAVIRSKSK